MLKVLHIVPGIPFGGMQKLAAELAAEQKARGFEVKFLMVYDSPPLAALLKELAVPALTVGGTRPSLGAAREFRKRLREAAPDLVHLHAGLLWTNLSGLMGKKCPWIYHAHNYPVHLTGGRGRLLKAVNGRLIDAVIGVSRSVSGEYERELKRRCPVFTVHNGIRLPANTGVRRQKPPNDPPRFGMATRFASDKGIFEFIEVAAEITRRLPAAEFVLAGDGPLLPAAKERARQVRLEGKLDFPGFVNDMAQFWNSLDVALFTSPKEPFGLRLIEPMAQQIPVAAYLTGAGSDEIIEDGKNAVAAPCGKPYQLAEQAVRLVTDATFREALIVQASHDVTTKFSIERMAAQVEEVYSNFAGSKKTRLSCLKKNLFTVLQTPRMWLALLRWNLMRNPSIKLPTGSRLGGFESFSEFWGAWIGMPTIREIEFLKTSLPSGAVFLDVGANRGVFSLLAADLIPHSRVFAFEPHPTTFKWLEQNLDQTGKNCFTTLNLAISDSTGEVQFSSGNASATNRIVRDDNAGVPAILVPAITLDQFIGVQHLGQVDLLKIDVEGFEPNVLRGAAQAIQKGVIKRIYLEVCPGNLKAVGSSVEELWDVCAHFGLSFYQLTNSAPVKVGTKEQLALVDLENFLLLPQAL